MIECAVDAKLKSLVIFARRLNEAALSLVHAANRQGKFQALAIKIPTPTPISATPPSRTWRCSPARRPCSR